MMVASGDPVVGAVERHVALEGRSAEVSLVGLKIAAAAPDLFGRLLGVGLVSIVAGAAFAHFGVTLGLLPTTGVNLPFVSAGGTHLLLAMGCTGVLLNIASKRKAVR